MGGAGSPAQPKTMGSEVRTLSFSTGIEVPCFIGGVADAKALVLLHAWGEFFESFDRLAPLLAGYGLHAPELRGHGGAD